MAVPKKRMSHARKLSRRSQHDRITPPTLSVCSHCGSPVRPHHVCAACGKYRSKQIIAPIIELGSATDEDGSVDAGGEA